MPEFAEWGLYFGFQWNGYSMNTFPPAQLTPEQLNYSDTAQWTRVLKQALMDLRCAAPGIVKSVDYTKSPPVVTVQVAISELVRGANGPQWTAIQLIANVPICLPRAGGFLLTLPVKAGDTGLLIFCDSCIDLWWKSGGLQPPPGAPVTQPNFENRRHDITDCGFIPGMSSQAQPVSFWSQVSAQLRTEDATVVVDIAPAGITLTAPKVVVNTTGDVDITAGGNMNMNATGNVNIAGANVIVGNNTKIDGKTFLTHEHSGVQSGGGNTGPVV